MHLLNSSPHNLDAHLAHPSNTAFLRGLDVGCRTSIALSGHWQLTGRLNPGIELDRSEQTLPTDNGGRVRTSTKWWTLREEVPNPASHYESTGQTGLNSNSQLGQISQIGLGGNLRRVGASPEATQPC